MWDCREIDSWKSITGDSSTRTRGWIWGLDTSFHERSDAGQTTNRIRPERDLLILSQRLSTRAPDKVRVFIPLMPISSSTPIFDHLLESSLRDDSNKWSNIGFSEEIGIAEVKIRTLSGALVESVSMVQGFINGDHVKQGQYCSYLVCQLSVRHVMYYRGNWPV